MHLTIGDIVQVPIRHQILISPVDACDFDMTVGIKRVLAKVVSFTDNGCTVEFLDPLDSLDPPHTRFYFSWQIEIPSFKERCKQIFKENISEKERELS